MGALPAIQTPVFDIAHLLGITAPEHFVHEAVVVGRTVARVDACKPVPVLSKDLFEDVPLLRGSSQHQGTPSWGVRICAVQLLYHASPTQSTLSSAYAGAHSPTALTLVLRGLQGS